MNLLYGYLELNIKNGDGRWLLTGGLTSLIMYAKYRSRRDCVIGLLLLGLGVLVGLYLGTRFVTKELVTQELITTQSSINRQKNCSCNIESAVSDFEILTKGEDGFVSTLRSCLGYECFDHSGQGIARF